MAFASLRNFLSDILSPDLTILGKYDFECSYNSTFTISTNTVLEIDDSPREIFGENETGNFDFSLDLYSSNQYDSKFEAEDEINVGERAFFGIQELFKFLTKFKKKSEKKF